MVPFIWLRVVLGGEAGGDANEFASDDANDEACVVGGIPFFKRIAVSF
jgi:hypothetical protein